MQKTSKKPETVEDILATYEDAHRDKLIPILQDVQNSFGYLSKEAIIKIGKHIDLPTSKIYGVATFYNQFRFQPIGKYHILVCRGTACHVKGSLGILNSLKQVLKVESGETTRDGLFSLEVVACIGACGLAPVISINGEFYAKVTPNQIEKIINDLRKLAEKEDK